MFVCALLAKRLVGLVSNWRRDARSVRFHRVANRFLEINSGKLCVPRLAVYFGDEGRYLPSFFGGERVDVFVRRAFVSPVHRHVCSGPNDANLEQEVEDQIGRAYVPRAVDALRLNRANEGDCGGLFVGLAILVVL